MNKISMLFAIILLLHFTSCTQNKKSDLEYLPEKIDSKGTLVIEGGGDRIEVILKTIIKYGGGDSAKLLVVPFCQRSCRGDRD